MGKKKAKESDIPQKEEFDPVELVTKRPQTVVLMLQSHEESVLQTVCEVLYKFAEKGDENKLQLLNLDAVKHLLSLLSHEDKIVKRNAVMCIGILASDMSIRHHLRKHDQCIASLLALLSPDEDVVCHEFSTLALSSLAEDYTGKLEIFEKGGLQLLISMLSSPDCDVQRNASKAVCLMADEFQSRAVINDLNGIEPLLKLVASDYPVIQELVLSTLIKCTQDADSRNTMRELGGLSKLVDIIGDQAMDDLHGLCLQCLANCLADTECLKAVQSTGVFQNLLAFIAQSENPVVQAQAAEVVAAAAKLDANRNIFHEQETEKTLIALLGEENLAVSVAAARGLAVLAEGLSCRERIGKLDGIPLLITMLKNDSSEAREVASLALANLTSSCSNNCQQLIDKHAPDLLIKLLSEEKSTIQRNAAICLSNLALNETWRLDVLKHGVVKSLLTAMQSEDTEVETRSLEALSSFVCDQYGRNQMLADHGLPVLVALLSSNHNTVRKNAAWCMAICASDSQLANELTDIGALAVLEDVNSSSRCSSFTKIAYERILDNNLSAKYAILGVLNLDNVITNGFYDTGRINDGKRFQTLQELLKHSVNQKRPVLLVYCEAKSFAKSKRGSDPRPTQIPEVDKSSEGTGRSRSKMESKRHSRRGNTSSERNGTPVDSSLERSKGDTIVVGPRVQPFHDESLESYFIDVTSNISPLLSLELQVRSLGAFVSDVMGGSVPRSDLSSFSYELHLSELKSELNSNVIPIGMIKRGIFYHRALLFKVLADHISIPCTLMRGDYGRAWNEVTLCEYSEVGRPLSQPKRYIVDLMHDPGELHLLGSPQSLSYQKIG